MAYKINPKWLAYNNVVNEGGEGYNPHPKYIAAPIVNKSARKIVYGGMPYTADELRDLLHDAEHKSATLESPYARQSWSKTVTEINSLLAGV